MPRKNKSQRNKTAVIVEKVITMNNQQPRKKKSKRAKRRSSALPTPMLSLARLIADPCGAPLTGVDVIEANIVERARAFNGVNNTNSHTCGYVVWFPSHVGHTSAGVSNRNYNCYLWESTNPLTVPINTAASPMGLSGFSAASGLFLPDPAAGTVSDTSPFSRQKTYSGCLQFEYLGGLTNIQGQVAVVKNLSLAAFNRNSGAPGAALVPMNVTQMFTYAQERERTQIGGHEAVWRPTADSCVYRTNGQEMAGLVGATTGDIANTVFMSGQAALLETVERSVNPNEIYGVAIAWQGLSVTQPSQLCMVKTFALELAPRAGTIETIPRQVKAETEGTYIARAVQYLDSVMPGWQGKIMNAGIDKVGALAMSYAPSMMRTVGPIRPSLRIRDGSL